MTDTHAQRILIERFKELEILEREEVVNPDGSIDVKYPEVSFPNEEFTRPEDGYWYELHPIPATPLDIELSLDARTRWVGVLQINLCVPVNSGMEATHDRFDMISQLYLKKSYIKGVRITKCKMEASFTDGDYCVTPVSISWWADLDR